MEKFSLQMQKLMLGDRERNMALRKAIDTTVRPGDVVIDVGTGTGMLAMFAARAGASRVYALECDNTSFIARRLVSVNGMQDVVKVIQTHSYDFDPLEKADLVVSETLGFLALDEGIREIMIDAKRRMLRPDGLLMPGIVKIMAAPACLHDALDPSRFSTIEGLDYRPFGCVLNTLYDRRYIPKDSHLALSALVLNLNLSDSHVVEPINGHATFEVTRPGIVTGFALWFEAHLTEHIVLSSQSSNISNHWAQAYLPIAPMQVEVGDAITLELRIDDRRSRFVVNWNESVLSKPCVQRRPLAATN